MRTRHPEFSTTGLVDLTELADLLRTGRKLGVHPYVGEEPHEYAERIGHELRRRRRSGNLFFVARISLAIALAAFGITTF